MRRILSVVSNSLEEHKLLVLQENLEARAQNPFEIHKEGPSLYTYAIMIAGVGVLLACSLSTFLIGEHLTAYNKPAEQKWIVGCIFMVPLYAICSFMSLWKPNLETVSNLIRSCYEAYTIYSFCMYLVACLGGEARTVEKMAGITCTTLGPHTPLIDATHTNADMCLEHNPRLAERPREKMEHPYPLNWVLEAWVPGPHMYMSIKFGVVQYMVLKCIAALCQLLLDPFHLYGEGDFDWATGYPYVAIVLNFSQCWAIYCLIMFYQATWQYLQPIRPLGKFVSIKSIIFVTWWQGIIIALMFATGLFKPPPDVTAGAGTLFQNTLQDFLVAVEMSLAAVAYLYSFPATPYQRMTRPESESASAHHVALLTDLANTGAPVDPEEVMASEDVGCLRFLHSEGRQAVTSFTASIQDVLFGGGETVMKDVRQTVHQAVEPVEKGFTKVNEGFQETLDLIHNKLPWAGTRRPRGVGDRVVQDDSCLHVKLPPDNISRAHSGTAPGLVHGPGGGGGPGGGSMSDGGLEPSERRRRPGGMRGKTFSSGNLENAGPEFPGSSSSSSSSSRKKPARGNFQEKPDIPRSPRRFR